MKGRKIRPYHKYTDEEIYLLWKQRGVQPCLYCGKLQKSTTCGVCGKIEDAHILEGAE